MNRIKAILVNCRYQKYFNLNNEYEQTREFCRHDWDHFLAVCRLSYILVLEDDWDKVIGQPELGELLAATPYPKAKLKELVYAAGMLHDIGRWQEYETGEDHALISGKLAIPILKKAGFYDQEILLIVTAIKEHSGIGEKKSYLGSIICKADNLARECHLCQVKSKCYKVKDMLKLYGETIY